MREVRTSSSAHQRGLHILGSAEKAEKAEKAGSIALALEHRNVAWHAHNAHMLHLLSALLVVVTSWASAGAALSGSDSLGASRVGSYFRWRVGISEGQGVGCSSARVPVQVADTEYWMVIQVEDAGESSIGLAGGDSVAALSAAFHSIGNEPFVTMRSTLATSSTLLPDAQWSEAGCWLLQFSTENAGLREYAVASRFAAGGGRVAVGLGSASVEDVVVRLRVSPVLRRESDLSYSPAFGSAVGALSAPSSGFSLATSDPRALSTMVAVPNGLDRVVLYTDSDWDAQLLVNMTDDVFVPSSERPLLRGSCNFSSASGSSAAELHSVVPLPNRMLVIGPTGLVQGVRSLNAASGWAWTLVLPKCVSFVSRPKQHSRFLPLYGDVVLAAGDAAAGAFLSRSTNDPFQELLDIQGQSLLDAYGEEHGWDPAARILAADMSILSSKTLLFLVDTANTTTAATSRYILYSFTLDARLSEAGSTLSGSWRPVFYFPTTVSAELPTLHDRRKLYNHGLLSTDSVSGGAAVDVELSGMQFDAIVGQDLYLWGSVLLYSPDGGESVFFLRAAGESARFTLILPSLDRYWIAFTSERNIFYGQPGSFTTVQLEIPSSLIDPVQTAVGYPSSSVLDTVYLDGSERMFYAAIANTSLTPVVAKSEDLRAEVRRQVLSVMHELGEECIFRQVSVSASRDPIFTRVISTAEEVSDSLPAQIFMDYGSTYKVYIDVALSAWAGGSLASASILGVQLTTASGEPPVELVVSRLPSADPLRVSYELLLTDLKDSREQQTPGTDLQVSNMRLLLNNASYVCQIRAQSAASPALSSSSTLDLKVYTGCPPGRVLSYDSAQSKNQFESCTVMKGTPCVSFAWEWKPVLVLHDVVTGESIVWKKAYSIRIIGGGSSPSNIRLYSKSELESFNQGAKAIWTSLDGVGDNGELEPGSSISWVCGIGSPCSGIKPDFPHTPDVYFRIEISTKGAVSGTYCDFSTTFTLRLHGLAMDYITIVTIAFICIAIFMGLVVLAYIPQHRKYSEFQRQIREAMDELSSSSSDDEDNASGRVAKKESQVNFSKSIRGGLHSMRFTKSKRSGLGGDVGDLQRETTSARLVRSQTLRNRQQRRPS